MEQQMVRLQATLEASEIQADRSGIKSYLERKNCQAGRKEVATEEGDVGKGDLLLLALKLSGKNISDWTRVFEIRVRGHNWVCKPLYRVTGWCPYDWVGWRGMGMLVFTASKYSKLLLPWWDSSVQCSSVLCRDPEATSDSSTVWQLCHACSCTGDLAEKHVGAVWTAQCLKQLNLFTPAGSELFQVMLCYTDLLQ